MSTASSVTARSLLGHGHPAIVEALRQHVSMGSLILNPPLAIDLAEEIQRCVPSAERIRFPE